MYVSSFRRKCKCSKSVRFTTTSLLGEFVLVGRWISELVSPLLHTHIHGLLRNLLSVSLVNKKYLWFVFCIGSNLRELCKWRRGMCSIRAKWLLLFIQCNILFSQRSAHINILLFSDGSSLLLWKLIWREFVRFSPLWESCTRTRTKYQYSSSFKWNDWISRRCRSRKDIDRKSSRNV